MTKNFPKLMMDTKLQIQVAQRTLRRISTHKATLRHIIFKLEKNKNKEEILKEAWCGGQGRRHCTYRETKIRIISDFSSETTQAGRQWGEIKS